MPILDEVDSSPSPLPSSPSPMPVTPANDNGTGNKQQLPPELQSQAKILALIERTGYMIVQENGQRRYGGPPPDWPVDRVAPSRGCEVFVGKIPRDCYEDELVPLFEKVGRIYELRLMMNFGGENRGYAFVMFTTKSEAQRAIRELNNYEIRKGRSIGVCLSVDNCRLFIGGIPKNKTKEETLEEMKKITTGVVDVIMYPSIMDKTKNRGFAFVEYESHKAAAMARRKLIPGRIQLWNQQVAVDWAEPERSVDDDTMSKVKILYIRNLMMSTTEQQIEQLFNNFLQKPKAIERVKKINDFAFVHFNDRDDALRCQENFNNTVIDSTVVEITLAKPPDKTTMKQTQQQQQQQQQQQVLQQSLQGSPVKMVSALEYNGIPLLAFTHPQLPLFGGANAANTLSGLAGNAALQQQFGGRNNIPFVNPNGSVGGNVGHGGKFSWKIAHQQQSGIGSAGGMMNRGAMRNTSQQQQHLNEQQQNNAFHSQHHQLPHHANDNPFLHSQTHPLLLDGMSPTAVKAPFGGSTGVGDSAQHFFDPNLAAAMLAIGQSGFDATALLQQSKVMATLHDVIKNNTAAQQNQQPLDQGQTPQQTTQQQSQDAQQQQQQQQLQQLMAAPSFVPSPTTPTAKTAYQILEEFCVMNGYPMPTCQMYVQYMPTTAFMTASPTSATAAGSTLSPTNGSSNNEDAVGNDKANQQQQQNQTGGSSDTVPRPVPVTVQTVQPMFACIVQIPGILSASSPRFSTDQNEAKHLAALVALSQLGANVTGFLSSPTLQESVFIAPPHAMKHLNGANSVMVADDLSATFPSPPISSLSSSASSMAAHSGYSPPSLSPLSVSGNKLNNNNLLMGSNGNSINGSQDSLHASYIASTHQQPPVVRRHHYSSSTAVAIPHCSNNAGYIVNNSPSMMTAGAAAAANFVGPNVAVSSCNWLLSPPCSFPESYALVPGVVPISPVTTSVQMRGNPGTNSAPFQILFTQAQTPTTASAVTAPASGHVHQVAAGVVP